MAGHAATHTQDHRPVTPHERGKRRVIALGRKGLKQLAIGKGFRFAQRQALELPHHPLRGFGCHDESWFRFHLSNSPARPGAPVRFFATRFWRASLRQRDLLENPRRAYATTLTN
jgi:hypothetical protein